MGHPAVNVSFILPLICFLIIIWYGYRAYTKGVRSQESGVKE